MALSLVRSGRCQWLATLTLATLCMLGGCASPTAWLPSTTPSPGAPPPPPESPQPAALPAAWPLSLQCGAQLFQVAPQGDTLQLGGDGLSLALQPVPSASGQKLVATAQPTTSVWLRGDHALVVLQGRALPECRILNRGAP